MSLMLAATIVVTLGDIIFLTVYVIGILVALAIAYNDRKGRQFDIDDFIEFWLPYTFLAFLWPVLAAVVIGSGLLVFICFCLGMMSYGLAWGSAYAFGYLIKGFQWIGRGCSKVLRRKGHKPTKVAIAHN